MNEPQLVLEEALECYLKQLQHGREYAKATDALIDFNFGLLIGLKAAHGEILKEPKLEEPK